MVAVAVAERKVDVARIYELLDEARATFQVKEKDYADQVPLGNIKAARRFGIPAWLGVLIRMGDKWERISNLAGRYYTTKDGPAVKGESIKDTLMDIAVYALICIAMWESEEEA